MCYTFHHNILNLEYVLCACMHVSTLDYNITSYYQVIVPLCITILHCPKSGFSRTMNFVCNLIASFIYLIISCGCHKLSCPCCLDVVSITLIADLFWIYNAQNNLCSQLSSCPLIFISLCHI